MGHRQGCILRRPKNESRKRTHHDRGQFIIASSDILRRAICLAAASSYSHHPAQIGRSGRWDPHAGVKLAQTGATWPVSPQLTHAVQTCHRKGMMNPMMMPDKARRPATQGEYEYPINSRSCTRCLLHLSTKLYDTRPA
ncbi:hypothetical protein HRR83_006929 [Exophiala dermatitidis]|uniref:Uncharacterized protein n=1 Tax=Exophiala dermatitidis TaxID=5970 RepID=A0AAN6EQK5_EXODE|nr:hypothetical protein HRR73_005968 [Exophiala dermatitidis]KAJ4512712.1 hypothetical protein HRR74_006410 [Exophiala dermatitidis]KAJ4542516.1 hypothetical protein HRR77_005714 [Exophiala dermatitidis]KAJ4548205.1 hypothetical protein HRR76_000812 [Exophiala dermatitidis]KAJ4570261.1 hypothetical protein HRR82_007470 [Exophiala dermatitidis]